jgi:hypothetical protein
VNIRTTIAMHCSVEVVEMELAVEVVGVGGGQLTRASPHAAG